MKLVDLAMLMIVIGKYCEQCSSHYSGLCSGRVFNVLIIVVIVVIRPPPRPHVKKNSFDSRFKTTNSVFARLCHTH